MQLGLLALVGCGSDAVTSDARLPCQVTADPHDEDNDGNVDSCDNCPATANPTQADTTEQGAMGFPDGVGDACDQRPTVSGDTLRAFYSFASDTQASAWTGTWTINGDAAHAINNAEWTSTRSYQGDGFMVRADLVAVALDQGSITIALDGDGVSVGGTCTLTPLMVTASEPGGESKMVGLTAIMPGEALTLIAWRTISPTRVAEMTCLVRRGLVTTEAQITLIDDLVTGTHVIRAIDASVDITSLSVYTTPGPKNP